MTICIPITATMLNILLGSAWVGLGMVGVGMIYEREIEPRGFHGKVEMFALLWCGIVFAPIIFIVGLMTPRKVSP